MGLETGTRIDDLDPVWPLGEDGLSQSDDHHRLIKKCVQGSFPSLGSTAVAATAVELNSLDGISAADTVENRLDDLETAAAAVAGTIVNLGGHQSSGFWVVSYDTVWYFMTITGGPANSDVSWYSSASGSDTYYDNGKLQLDAAGNGIWGSVSSSIQGNTSVGGYFTQTIRVHDDTGGRNTNGTARTDGYYNYTTYKDQ